MKPKLVFVFTAGLVLLSFAILPSSLRAQSSNPVPFISEPLVPDAAVPGAAGFTLTVNGTGFVSGATVFWNGTPLPTTFVSASELTAAVPASDVSVLGTASVVVANPASDAKSNTAFFPVTPTVISGLVNATGSPIGVGGHALGIAVGDFNRDGRLDVAASNQDGNTVTILLGNGDGTFAQASGSPIPLAGTPSAIAVGDFNGDGKADLAVVGNMGGNVEILLGNGDGTFQPPVNYGDGGRPSDVAIGDFNGDGKLDLAISDFGRNVDILLGNGDGTFQPAVAYPEGSEPYSVAVGDFNGDGRLDLAVADYNGNAVIVLLGNGDGTFSPMSVVPAVGSSPTSVAAGDFNGDGKLDLAVANSASNNVTVLLGNGDGTFQPPVNYSAGGDPRYVAVGDFNGDGKLDLALAHYWNGGLSILLGNGDGTFQPAVQSIADLAASSLAVGDFNGDGKLDLAAALTSTFNGGEVSIVLQSPAGLSAVNLAFGNELVGKTSPAQTVKLANSGSAPLTIANLGITGANSSFALDTSGTTCSESTPVASGGSCAISVGFAPTADGTLAGTLSINDSALDSPQAVSLTGTGIAPVAALSPASLSFSAQTVGSASGPQVVTLSNTGNAALNITSISIAANFTETNNCGSSVAAGANCAINVSFAPTAAGSLTGTLSIADNATDSPQTVSLTGTGRNGPLASLSTTSLSFASQVVGTTSAPGVLTLSNGGNTSLSVTSITTSGDFSETNNCGSSVAAGASCTINVTFLPTASGSRNGSLSIADNALDSPQGVSLTGTGADFSVSVQNGAASSATVTAGGAGTYLLSLVPVGGFNQAVSFTCSGAPSEATCTVTPSSVTLDGTNAATVKVTATTTAASLAIPTGPVVPPTNRPVWVWALMALVLMMLALPDTRRANRSSPERRPRARIWRAALATILLCMVAFAACGSGGGSSGSNTQTNPGTPTGTYTLTVTGSSGSLSHSTSLTLKVQ